MKNADRLSPIDEEHADDLVKHLTAWASLRDLCDSYNPLNGHVPTIRPADGPKYLLLADLYDAEQARRGCEARAWRGSTKARR
jgi:hypothetical protein